MTVSIEEFMADFKPDQQARVQARTLELQAEEATLRDLRQAHRLTQARMAQLMGVEQKKSPASNTAPTSSDQP